MSGRREDKAKSGQQPETGAAGVLAAAVGQPELAVGLAEYRLSHLPRVPEAMASGYGLANLLAAGCVALA